MAVSDQKLEKILDEAEAGGGKGTIGNAPRRQQSTGLSEVAAMANSSKKQKNTGFNEGFVEVDQDSLDDCTGLGEVTAVANSSKKQKNKVFTEVDDLDDLLDD